jgi:hypothetical protein
MGSVLVDRCKSTLSVHTSGLPVKTRVEHALEIRAPHRISLLEWLALQLSRPGLLSFAFATPGESTACWVKLLVARGVSSICAESSV